MCTQHNTKKTSILRNTLSLMGCLLIACLLTGCDTPPQKVAKDWCEVIRASQIIPVYPLTEDLQPGDVFLVTLPVQDQAKQYEKRGFLPFDYHVARLHVCEISEKNYHDFYRGDYFEGSYGETPHLRPRRDSHNAATSTGSPAVQTFEVPRAAFPSYTFDIKSNQGLQLALPVKGVPVGMDLLNATAAAGTINITDAYTYGVDAYTLAKTLYERVESNSDLQAQLANLVKAHSGVQLYLRIVYRVYLTGGVDISLRKKTDYGLLGEVGASFVGKNSPERRLDPNNLKNYVDALRNLQEDKKLLWGGAIRISGGSSYSITLKENFDRPLVVGYLGVDMPVTPNGRLGTPVATSILLYKMGREPRVVAGGQLTRVQNDVKMRLRNIKYLFDLPGREKKDEMFAEQLAEADQQLGKPKSLDRFRAKLTGKTDFEELFKLFYDGCMSYASRTDENSKAHYKITIVLDKAIANLE